VAVTASGAHLVSLKDAVQEKLSALSATGGFVERLVRDENLQPIPQTADYVAVTAAEVGSLAASPPPHVKDVRLTLGIDKGGMPSSVKIVVGVANKLCPHKLNNTILVAVCPANREKYDEVAEMLGEHLTQVLDLVRDGVMVGGGRRAVRMLLTSDYEALCTLHRHKGPSATMPCLMYYATKAPSLTHSGLDSLFGTLQEVEAPSTTPLRTSSHLEQIVLANALHVCPGEQMANLPQAGHRSIERPPLLCTDPLQIVPIPLHSTMGITPRLLRLAVELIFSCRGRAAGLAYAYGLAETLRCVVRVRPAPYHCGVFIGRDCHTIAESSDEVCRTLLGLVLEKDHAAYRRLWVLWRKLVRTMNRAAEVEVGEAKDVCSTAHLFVRHLKHNFPWVSISPKLHILLRHAPDFLDRFGSIGLYGEQAIESWNGHYNQKSATYAAGTEADACANLVRAMAIAKEASDSNLVTALRRPAKEGARRARKDGDGRLRVNKGGVGECRAARQKAIQEGRQWAQSIFREGDRTFATFLTRLASGED